MAGGTIDNIGSGRHIAAQKPVKSNAQMRQSIGGTPTINAMQYKDVKSTDCCHSIKVSLCFHAVCHGMLNEKSLMTLLIYRTATDAGQ